MDLRTMMINPGILALVVSGFLYGYKFLRRGNILLGFEWIILAYSASNMFLYFNGWNESAGVISLTCDAFSRSVGIPVIGVLGFLKLTHKYEPTLITDIILFAGGFLLAVVLLDSRSLEPYLPVAYMIGSVAWWAYQFYFSTLLWKRGLKGFAVVNVFLVFWMAFVAALEGAIAIPNDETNLVLNFFFIAHWTWAIGFAFLYYAYVAYENSLESAAARG